MQQTVNKINLLGLDREKMQAYFASIGEKPYRADQVIKWLHTYGVTDFQAMSNLSKDLRAKLSELTEIALPSILHQQIAKDGTYKWVIRLSDGNCIESVFIPEKTRGTLCISSQVGCILNCDFCSTGKQGFNRNLSTAEIIGQLWLAVRNLSRANGAHDHAITNVVMMGMGEPLLNIDNLLPALNLMLDDHAYGLAKRRVTVSTAGIVPGIQQLRAALDVALAISLHAPNNQLRNQLVPLNKKYPLEVLMPACDAYFKHDEKRFVTMEYVMLKNVNDSMTCADELIKLLKNRKVKVNLIPFNPFPHTAYERSSDETIAAFQARLKKAGLVTTVRRTRGDNIDGACGQLVGQVKDRTRRHERYLKNIRSESAS